ncbi:ABC transporter ATP-binding protein [Dulcicalothrix desertica PCC 7102]|uniref:ABC transporter ATP-binding protein n=1 Tax=Dulcicalothrix desertica PCC 7102 TaxID=232991 RepID=A0A433VM55_9CYAN|nr:ABC transporter ATP-binding protein [Dulcicalothrix desertica]RUT07186.1 ABC transporter ATP-binding protein [Dulcicalothrix desertica PCC 7102]TWH61819.1 lipopolysaccharide transport system ATP-binding protein [Dulcicalothrix desertica PCC 7102]
MSDTVIRVRNLGKKYVIGHKQEGGYTSLRDVLTNRTKALLNPSQFKSKTRSHKDEFWALKDLSFDIKQGDKVGVIGRNGAGKSTLLKVLSRITEPTKGRINVKGRIASLLEVGTGFHPELTGRENMYLNGAILGMSKAEIQQKFDEIVAFAEVEKFLDTPVKRYSSGMYVRLAFAVAVHLEPEILVIDEVLAVGDAQFQKKCLNKMSEVAKQGRTILFVSHNMSAIRSLCNVGLVLSKGTLKDIGEITEVTDRYLADVERFNLSNTEVETKSFYVKEVKVYTSASPVLKTFDLANIKVAFSGKEDVIEPDVYISICSLDGHRIVGMNFRDFQEIPLLAAGKVAEVTFSIDSLPLLPGQYQLEVQIKDLQKSKFELLDQTFPLEVVETPIYGGRQLDKAWFGHIGLKVNSSVQIIN